MLAARLWHELDDLEVLQLLASPALLWGRCSNLQSGCGQVGHTHLLLSADARARLLSTTFPASQHLVGCNKSYERQEATSCCHVRHKKGPAAAACRAQEMCVSLSCPDTARPIKPSPQYARQRMYALHLATCLRAVAHRGVSERQHPCATQNAVDVCKSTDGQHAPECSSARCQL